MVRFAPMLTQFVPSSPRGTISDVSIAFYPRFLKLEGMGVAERGGCSWRTRTQLSLF